MQSPPSTIHRTPHTQAVIKLDVGVDKVAPLQLQIPFDHVVNHARILSLCTCLQHVGVDAAALESVYRWGQGLGFSK